MRFDRIARRAFIDGREIELTRRELDLLSALMWHPGRVVSKDDLMDAVYPRTIDVGPNALELLISRLRQKLRPAGVNVRALRGVGYRIEDAAGDEQGNA